MNVRINDAGARRAYEALQTSGTRGRELAAVLERRGTRVIVTKLVSGGFTLTFLNTIFLQPLGASANEQEFRVWVALLAHEASHIEQNFWVDSIVQEMRAYTAQVCVAQELGIDLSVLRQAFEHLNADVPEHRTAAQVELNRLFGRTAAGILYACLPTAQPRGGHAIGPALRQMGALVRAAFYRQGAG